MRLSWGDISGHKRNSGRMGTGILVALLMGVSLLLVACEYPGIAHPLAAQESSDSSGSIEPTPSPTSQASDGDQIEEPEIIADTVPISLMDFKLEPNEVRAKAGTVTFQLKNAGRYTHDFRVEGQGIDKKAPKVGRGREREWQITLPPGTYKISCPISNHADRGMTGTLEILP